MGHQRLAGAGFTVDQYMPVRLTEIEDIFAQPLHHRALTDELFHQLAAIRQLAAQRAVVHDQTAGIGRLLGKFAHPVGVERLFEEIEGPYPHRFDGHGHVAVAGDHDDR